MANFTKIGTMVLFLCWVEVNCEYTPIAIKRKLVLLGSQATWNDAAKYCSTVVGGTLLAERSPPFAVMLKRYRENEWETVWNDNRAWLGLFIGDINIPVFNWAQHCKTVNTDVYHAFGSTVPSAPDLTPENLCGYKDFLGETWGFEKCSSLYSAVCAKTKGPCTYQRGNEQNVCLKGISMSYATNVTSRTDCEDTCSNSPVTAEGECWAVTYIPHSDMCVPSFSTDPLNFDLTNSLTYESPCRNPLVTSISNQTSVVSWKRCFEDPAFDTKPIPSVYPDDLEPLHDCNTTVSQETPTTAQPIQPTTPILEYFYPSSHLKRRFILLAKYSTFNDAVRYCQSEYNGSLITHDNRAVGVMIYSYLSDEWQEWQDDVFWEGIFVSDLEAPSVTYQSNCSVVNIKAFHLFNPTAPTTGSLNQSNLCVKGDFERRGWYFEKCNETLSAICEQIVGPCTIERDSGGSSCVAEFNSNKNIRVENLTECERYCSLIESKVLDKGECWAVTYLPETGHCIPAIDRDPLKFDSVTPKYQNPCQHNAIISLSNGTSVVSWKRCFVDPIYDSSVIPDEDEQNEEPTIWCDLPVSISTMITPITATTTSGTMNISLDSTSGPTTTTTGTTSHISDSTSEPTTTTTETSLITESISEPTILAETTTNRSPHTTLKTSTSPDSTSIPTTGGTPIPTTSADPITIEPIPMTSKSPDEPSCECTCVFKGNITVQEKTVALKKKLTMNKQETSAHTRSLTSASDDRLSARSVGMTVGVGMLMGVLVIISLGDVILVCKFLYSRILK